MRHTDERHRESEKIDIFVALLLSEQLGPLTHLQRDVLDTIRTAAGRLADRELGAMGELLLTEGNCS